MLRIGAEKDLVPLDVCDENIVGHGEAFKPFLGDAPYVGGNVHLVVFSGYDLLLRQVIEHVFKRHAQILSKLLTEKGHIAGGLSRSLGVFLHSLGHPIAHLAVGGLERYAQRPPLLDCLNGMLGDPCLVFLGMSAANRQHEGEKKEHDNRFFHRYSPLIVE